METRKTSFNVQCGRTVRTQSVIESKPAAPVPADPELDLEQVEVDTGVAADGQELAGELGPTPDDDDEQTEDVADAEDTDDVVDESPRTE